MKYFSFLIIIISSLASAEYHCFTHSNEILFKAVGKEEESTMKRVIEGCLEHPYTSKEECTKNAKCFEQK